MASYEVKIQQGKQWHTDGINRALNVLMLFYIISLAG